MDIRLQEFIDQNVSMIRETTSQLLLLRQANSSDLILCESSKVCVQGECGIMHLDIRKGIDAYIEENINILREIENSLLRLKYDDNENENLKLISRNAYDVAMHSNNLLKFIERIKFELRLRNSINN